MSRQEAGVVLRWPVIQPRSSKAAPNRSVPPWRLRRRVPDRSTGPNPDPRAAAQPGTCRPLSTIMTSTERHAMYISTDSLPDEFDGRRALVTGGSRGIGAAIAQRLLDGGARVATSARSAAEDTPKNSAFIVADLRSESGAQQLVEQAREALGGLDIVVNAAGASRVFMGGPATIPDHEWQDSVDINFLSAVRVTNAALPALRESGVGAAIVNISTGIAKRPAQLPYCTTPRPRPRSTPTARAWLRHWRQPAYASMWSPPAWWKRRAEPRSCRPSPMRWGRRCKRSRAVCRSDISVIRATSPRRSPS